MTQTRRKGIILAGGSGSRLWPLTQAVSKQLLPVYDKPLVYYPLTTLMQAGIREILLISGPRDLDTFEALLGDGGQWGLSLSYAVQAEPEGIAQALVIARDFIGGCSVCLILGDNIFYASGFSRKVAAAAGRVQEATVFAYRVVNPERYGVVSLDAQGRPVRIEEKPQRPESPYAVTGLYFYPNDVIEIAAVLRPSARGELEITDVNRAYLERGLLRVEILEREATWLDAGTHDSLLDAALLVRSIEERQGLKIACPEEVAYQLGFIDADWLKKLASSFESADYEQYLLNLLRDGGGKVT
jgi:glucose-1-phosphate thymidylyltransferase